MSDQLNISTSSLTVASGSGLSLSPNGTDDSSIKIDLINNKKLTVQEIYNELIQRGYSDEEAKDIVTKHPEVNTLQTLNEQYPQKNGKLTLPLKSNEEKAVSDSFEVTTGINYNFKEFKNKDKQGKGIALIEEYTKNLNKFNPGALGIKGDSKEWNELTPEEQKKLQDVAINKLYQQYKEKDKNIDYDTFVKLISQEPKNKKEFTQPQIDAFKSKIEDLMVNIQVANFSGKDVESFLSLDNSGNANSDKYNFLNKLHDTNPEAFENISAQDIAYWEYENLAVEALKNSDINIKDKDNLTPARVNDIISGYNSPNPDDPRKNISRASLIYDYVSKIPESERTETQQRLFKFYDGIKNKGVPLSIVSDFDATNRTGREIYQSTVFQKAVDKARKDNDNGSSNISPAHAGRRAYVKNLVQQAIAEAKGSPDQARVNIHNAIAHLYDGASLDEMYQLNKVIDELDNEKFFDEQTQIYTNENSVLTRGPNSLDARRFNRAADSGVFKNRQQMATFAAATYADAGKMDDLLTVQRSNSMDHKLVASHISSEDDRYYVANDLNINFEAYSQEARNDKIEHAGYYVSEQRSNEFQTNLKNTIIEHEDEYAYEAFGKSASSYKGKGQVSLANHVMGMTEYFSDEANIRAQSALANDVQNCDVENQLEIHSTIMNNSQYDEVLELAASNIHNYDESVQAGAIEVTYATGNEKAISACEGQLDQCKGVNASDYTYSQYAENKNAVNTIQDAVNNLDLSNVEDQQKFLEIVKQNGAEVTKYLASCTREEKASFVEKFCSVASESDLLAFVANNKNDSDILEFVLRHAKNISKEKLFGAIYTGNKGDIPKLLSLLDIKGNSVINLARTYKEFAPDIALAMQSSELATQIVKNPDGWGYNMGDSRTEKLNELASQNNIQAYNDNVKSETTGFDELPSLEFYPKKSGYLLG